MGRHCSPVSMYIQKLRNNWRRYSLWGIFWALIIVPLILSMVYLGLHEGDASRGYVPELRRIASETPVYPRSKKIDEKVVLKQSMAYLFVSYTTPVAFDEIESFYKRELPARGWALPKGPPGRFIDFDAHSSHYWRGAYCIVVEHDPSLEGSYEIVFMWDPE